MKFGLWGAFNLAGRPGLSGPAHLDSMFRGSLELEHGHGHCTNGLLGVVWVKGRLNNLVYAEFVNLGTILMMLCSRTATTCYTPLIVLESLDS